MERTNIFLHFYVIYIYVCMYIEYDCVFVCLTVAQTDGTGVAMRPQTNLKTQKHIKCEINANMLQGKGSGFYHSG